MVQIYSSSFKDTRTRCAMVNFLATATLAGPFLKRTTCEFNIYSLDDSIFSTGEFYERKGVCAFCDRKVVLETSLLGVWLNSRIGLPTTHQHLSLRFCL